MVQKHFMDIQRLKEGYADGFQPGDYVSIQEKVDGSNASFRYDEESGKLVAFSRKKTLDFQNTLSGFWNYIQSLDAEKFKDTPNYVVFGEWTGARNAIVYDNIHTGQWYVYDIYDVETEEYLPQYKVRKFVAKHGLTYVHTFYEGKWISWDHAMSFIQKPAYGDIQEGIVIKNMTRLNDPNSRLPFVVKVVGEKFHEVKKDNHIKKIVDPQKLQEREEAMRIVKSIVTKRRVEKHLYKMRDDGLIPTDWSENDMGVIARNLPSLVFEDCMKEEKETVEKAGKFFGKFCSSVCMMYAKNIVLGIPLHDDES